MNDKVNTYLEDLNKYVCLYRYTKMERDTYKEKLDKINYIFNIWNYYLPDEAIKDIKEILEDE